MPTDYEELVVGRVAYPTRLPQSYKNRPRYEPDDHSAVHAPMPGTVLELLAEPGSDVGEDTPVLVLEAMKVENRIRAGRRAKLLAYAVEPGQVVTKGALLFRLALS